MACSPGLARARLDLPAQAEGWYLRTSDGETGTLTAFISTDFPDGAMVGPDDVVGIDLASVPSVWGARYEPPAGRLLEARVVGSVAPLWFVEMAEPDAAPPAVNLVAFSSDHFPRGAVITNEVFEPVAVRSADQVGAIRWWPGTGQIHQVYVAPLHRRRGIARALIYAASAHLLASGSSRRLWASGDRTDLGEALAMGMPYPQRVRRRERVLPPMTPAPDAVGVPARNLFPIR